METIVDRESQVQTNQLKRNGIKLYQGTARFETDHTLQIRSTEGDRLLSAAKFLISVGTKPVQPRQTPKNSDKVITSDQICNLKTLPKAMAVVGCGVIGIEYASMFARLGVEVLAIDGREEILDFIDEEIVDELVHQMRDAGVTFRLGETVKAIRAPDGPEGRLHIETESGKRTTTDLVLVSAGRRGATDRLNLKSAGLRTDDRGRLKVDERFRTSAKHIFAAGDVIGFPSLAATSAEQGRRAACHAFGVEVGLMPKHFPIGIYAIPEMSMVGATEKELTAVRIPYETGLARYREIARGQILGDDTGLLKLIFHSDEHRLLGVHAIGTGATELVHIGQAVLGLGGGLEYFLETVFNYPTLAECYKVAALDAYNKIFA